MSQSNRAKYEALLVALHQEMRAGRREGQRAAEIEGEMDAPWYALSDDERALFDDLSEDLYIIEGKRRIEPLAEGETPVSVMQQLPAAFKAKDDRRTLQLLRKLPTLEAPHVYVMGRCWDRQEFFWGAVCFYDFAKELQPKDVYEVSALEALVRAGSIEQAEERARGIETRPIVSGTLLLQAASILHRAATRLEETERRSTLGRVTKLVECAWDDATALPSVRASGLLAAGFAYEHLGDREKALRSFERAVTVHRSEAPLLARGLALLHSDRPRAMRDFIEAARSKTKLDWPYLYATHHALQAGRYAEVERFCEDGLAVSTRSEVRGRLLEWWAIAAAMLGHPAQLVNALFEQAMTELPLDPQIRRNAERYREALYFQKATPANDWELSTDIDEAQAWESLRQLAA
ncbi:hypothetical protein [Polyangium jinanense]|uniref:Tetratricopeptide repeat protein n=1 Tax=Polyangium jinanense TaxID=2829994 RepID=A0A9X3X3R8_9BACT|nr:hypothetical protein [Polyangium jinanense]MDC3954518.1 hypothetical protein [Polyangium jinanense]MDC3980821.1 hypothetical protein [Polyangium jinanense]